MGDQAGAIHIWDLKTDHNEKRVPDAEASIQSIAVDDEGKTMAAVNNKVGKEKAKKDNNDNVGSKISPLQNNHNDIDKRVPDAEQQH